MEISDIRKADVVRAFGGKAVDVARAMGISRASVSKWPDPLPPRIADRVLGAATRLGIAITRDFHKPREPRK